MDFKYLDIVRELLSTIERDEGEHMARCVDVLYDCIWQKHSIYTFGASHAGILSEEMYYRAGGLMLMNPIFGREIMLDTEPITHTSAMERLVGYGTELAHNRADFQAGDVLIAHSVSGRNPVTVEVAMAAKDAGATVIAITNLSYSKSVSSRHPSGKRLCDLADIILDNHGENWRCSRRRQWHGAKGIAHINGRWGDHAQRNCRSPRAKASRRGYGTSANLLQRQSRRRR